MFPPMFNPMQSKQNEQKFENGLSVIDNTFIQSRSSENLKTTTFTNLIDNITWLFGLFTKGKKRNKKQQLTD